LKKELLIDLSWINTKLSGGGYHSVQNIINCILNNNKISSIYDITIILRKKSIKNHFSKKIRIIELPNFYFLNFLLRWFILFIFSKNKKTQIYLCPNIYCALFKFNFKTINVFHDNQWKYFPEYYSIFKIIWIKFNIFLCIKFSDKIICTSKFILNEFRGIDKDKKLIQIYIPFKKKNKYKKIFRLKQKYVLLFSSLLPHKNIDIIKNIFLNSNSFKNINSLVVAGIGGKSKKISFGGKNVIFMKDVSESEKNWLFKNCEYFIHPSKYEGFGMTIVEAMLEKKTIICSDLKIFREIGQNSLVYVKNYSNHNNWLKIITNLNYKKTNNFKRINFEKKFSFKVISEKYLNIFENLKK
jgi:glycosyltransferase involved in cell wall biosynthesis